MAYNPNNAIKNIVNYKSQWDEANKAGNEQAKLLAQNSAKQYYDELEKNGYADAASQLRASGLDAAKMVQKKYAPTGMTKTRDYAYSVGKNYGLSNTDIDNIVTWNNDTGEVMVGGKNIGRPDLEQDGVSYWKDTTALDTALRDYAERSGTPASKSNMVNTQGQKLFDKYESVYENLANGNPFDTATAKAILGKYDLAALQGRDNAVASGTATNGGNIDSFAAANAMRQQASLYNQGQMAVLDAHQQRMDNVRNILSDLGVHIDRVYAQDETTKAREFNQEQTAKLNEQNMAAQRAEIMGENPLEWEIMNDATLSTYLNPDGSFKDSMKNVDIQALINEAKASGNTELAEKLSFVRAKKIYGDYTQFGKYEHQGDKSFNLKTRATDSAKNSAAARAEVEANITGEVPIEYVLKNNPFLNEDGTIKDKYKDVDFAAVMAKAKQGGDDAVYNAAATARYYKIMNNYGLYKQYDDGNYKAPTTKQTEAGRQFDEQNKTALAVMASEATIDKYLADLDNQVKNKELDMLQSSATTEAERKAYLDATEDALSDLFAPDETKKREFITKEIKPLLDDCRKGNDLDPNEVKSRIIEKSKDYNIDVTDAEAICNILKVPVVGFLYVTNDEGKRVWLYEDDPNDSHGGMVPKATEEELKKK